jgi:hypothetical protein
MKKQRLITLIAPLLFVTFLIGEDGFSPLNHATCTGADPCHACKNCRYCAHCAKEGGTCGVCKNRVR